MTGQPPPSQRPAARPEVLRPDANARLLTLMQLEERVRAAQSSRELDYFVVNETKRLIEYQQALLFSYGGGLRHRWKLTTVSSLATVEKDAPFVRWAERTLKALVADPWSSEPRVFSIADQSDSLRESWSSFSFAHVLWVPVMNPARSDPKKALSGGLWLAREKPWTDAEMGLMVRLAGSYGYAMSALNGGKSRASAKIWPKIVYPTLLAGVIAAMALPVPLTVLSPAEVVASNPTVVAAPVDGVVSDVLVTPNARVAKGDALVLIDDTELRNQFALAVKTLEVRVAEFKAARQGATLDRESKGRLAVLKEEVELAQAERNYRQEQLERTRIVALHSGLALYSNKRDWIGRPVRVGERIMEIADPEQVELRIRVPIGDAIILGQGNKVELFLDADPLNPLQAELIQADYQAREYDKGTLAYRVKARFSADEKRPRVGLRGTAKVYGETVPLYFVLFRRPIATVRQYFGL